MKEDEAMDNFRRCLCAACTLLLLGCAASAPVNYYRLAPLELDPAGDGDNPTILALGPLGFPEYLRQPQLVRRGAGSRMQVDDLNRWVEPLDDATARVLAANVDGLLDGVVAVAFPSIGPLEADYRLTGSISRFEADETGRVELVVQWSIGRPGEGLVVAPRTDRYTAAVARPQQPASVAEAMADALGRFSRDVAATLESVL